MFYQAHSGVIHVHIPISIVSNFQWGGVICQLLKKSGGGGDGQPGKPGALKGGYLGCYS